MPRRRTWTDDDLREALRGATSMAQVVRRLRLSRGGAAYVTVRSRMEQLGLDVAPPAVDGLSAPAARTSWTEGDVRSAVTRATSLNDVFTRLGLSVGGSQWLVLRSLIVRRGWSTAHWTHPLCADPDGAPTTAASFRDALEGADLPRLVRTAQSRAAVIRSLGHEPTTTTYRLLRQVMHEQELPEDHFEGHHEAMRRQPRRRYRIPLEDILVEGSTYTSTATLKRRLVEDGILSPECAICGLDQWRGEPIALHLDHVNGVRNDHREENLRLLCPNCHSQTTTFAGRNRGRYARTPPAEG